MTTEPMSSTTTNQNPTKVTKRPASERGRAEHGWLHARFTFSFAEYFDPAHMGFRSLRVMNNDTIEPGGGFGTHPHKDAEIFTYVIHGQLQHKDSMGNGAIIEPGDMQYMSAGSGVTHSEFNPSKSNPTELYQIWLRPNQSGGAPLYSEKQLSQWSASHDWIRLFSGSDTSDGATKIRQDADILFARIEAGKKLTLPYSAKLPNSWIQIIKGDVEILDVDLSKADGLAIENHNSAIEIVAKEDTEAFVFQLN